MDRERERFTLELVRALSGTPEGTHTAAIFRQILAESRSVELKTLSPRIEQNRVACDA